jgi:inner membrane protein involved in colicin E2 resistance
MLKRILAIAFIFVCTSIAWAILGSTIFARTYDYRSSLEQRIASTWGAPQVQKAPAATYCGFPLAASAPGETSKPTLYALPLESSRVRVAFNLEHRQKGLLWYATYKVAFIGDYVFRNTSPSPQDVTFQLAFPVAQAVYDDLEFSIDGKPVSRGAQSDAATATVPLAAGQTATLHAAYRSQGLDSWRYSFGADVAQVKDFVLTMTTNFRDIDFPENTLSPSAKQETSGGWALTWSYKNLVSGFQIGMTMPQKLQPGPLAGKISYFAPVSLLFFFFLIFIITTLRRIELHPMNYFFLTAAFFSFHLLLAYLADRIPIHAAFLVCSLVSIFLVVSYLRLVVNIRFAAVEAGVAQLIYLVLFSYAFFLKSFTGLAITIGSILTLFVVMQLTGRIRWAERFSPEPRPR